MQVTTAELVLARQAASALLDALGLDAYLFEVEPQDGPWEMRIECPVREGWQALQFAVDKDRLLASQTDDRARDELMAEWRQRLASCMCKDPDA